MLTSPGIRITLFPLFSDSNTKPAAGEARNKKECLCFVFAFNDG